MRFSSFFIRLKFWENFFRKIFSQLGAVKSPYYALLFMEIRRCNPTGSGQWIVYCAAKTFVLSYVECRESISSPVSIKCINSSATFLT